MTRLSRLSRLCLALSGLCFLAFAIQFFTLAYAIAKRPAEPPRSGVQANAVAGPLKMPLLREPPMAPRADHSEARSSTVAEPEAPVLRAIVYVKREGGRAEVYINGRRTGQTPYVGDLHCKAGSPIKVELLPPNGAPLRQDVECTSEMRVSFGRAR